MKISPLYTAFAHFARQLDAAGADGIVLFSRFHRADRIPDPAAYERAGVLMVHQ